MKFPTMDEFAQMVADKAIDEVEYNGKTIREWTEIILANASEDTISRRAAIKEMFEHFGANSIEDVPLQQYWNPAHVIRVFEESPPVTYTKINPPSDYARKIAALPKEGQALPPVQPDKDKVSDLLYHIYSIQSPHLDMCGVIAKKFYCKELWKELYGEESELPWWMN